MFLVGEKKINYAADVADIPEGLIKIQYIAH